MPAAALAIARNVEKLAASAFSAACSPMIQKRAGVIDGAAPYVLGDHQRPLALHAAPRRRDKPLGRYRRERGALFDGDRHPSSGIAAPLQFLPFLRFLTLAPLSYPAGTAGTAKPSVRSPGPDEQQWPPARPSSKTKPLTLPASRRAKRADRSAG